MLHCKMGEEGMDVISSTQVEVTSTTAQPLLPPCRVCGEKASGFHYGVNTCEACKGFFRRSLHRKHDYQCSGNNNCEIGPGKRNSCAKCRYEKCINVGMSKQAIKTGRYTHEKRTRDIKEIKLLQQKQAGVEEQQVSEDRGWELEQMVERIVKVHQQQTPLTEDFYKELPIRQAKFLERKRLEEETFGQMKPIPREEYREFYEKTGIDVDGRRELIVSMIPYLEEGIRRFICLAKAVPGFKELPVDDQIGLLKTNKMECGFITKYKLINPELGVCSSTDGVHVRVCDCIKLEHYPTTAELTKKAEILQNINFTIEENVAFFAVALLFTDRSELECPQQVEHYQMVMVEALQHLLKKNHPDDPLLFARLMVFLMDLRSLTELHAKNIEKVHLEFNDIQFPPLLYEML